MRNLKFLQLTLLASLFVVNAIAAEIDTAKSVLNWTGKKVTGKHYGKVSFKSGSIEEKDGKLAGGSFVVDMSTITVDDLTGEWAQKFLGHMNSGDFFMVEKYKTAKLVVTKVDGSKVTADLTIKDKTNPVTFEYKKEGNTFSGEFTFDRTNYDIKFRSGKFFESLGDKLIYDDVEMKFNVVLK